MTLSANNFLALLISLLVFAARASAFVAPNAPFVRTTCSGTAPTTRLFMSDEEEPAAAADSVQKGTVKWFNTMKGFGFIQPEDGSTDVFVHQTSIKMEGFRSLADGESVEYKVEMDNSGRKKAVQVTGPEGAEVQGAPFQPQDDYDRY